MAGQPNATKAKKNLTVRNEAEFSLSRLQALLKPQRDSGRVLTAWSAEEILAARRMHLLGHFALASTLADAMKTDDALYTAWRNRLAPQVAVGVEMVPAKQRGLAVQIAEEADPLYGLDGTALRPETMQSIHGCLVDIGIAFGYNVLRPRADGSRVDVEHLYWPIRFVRWDDHEQCFMARVENAGEAKESTRRWFEVPIVHGDGRWVIYQLRDHEPWKMGAIVPGSLVWSRHSFAMWDWSRGSKSHGDAKIIGEMPEGVPLQRSDGDGAEELTSEASALLVMLDSFVEGTSQVGITPAKTKVEFVANSSTAWQVWKELADKAEKAAARIYLGTDGTLGTQGGAPGVDVTAMFGVATTIVQGDLGVITRAVKTGLLDVWCALNFGDSSLAPTRYYMLPDTEEEEDRAQMATRRTHFYGDIKQARDLGFVVDRSFVREVARIYQVDSPELPDAGNAAAPTIALAPIDLANVILVNEARASAGLGPLLDDAGNLDPAGRLTISAFRAKQEEAIARSAAEAQAAAASPPAT